MGVCHAQPPVGRTTHRSCCHPHTLRNPAPTPLPPIAPQPRWPQRRRGLVGLLFGWLFNSLRSFTNVQASVATVLAVLALLASFASFGLTVALLASRCGDGGGGGHHSVWIARGPWPTTRPA